MSFASNGLQTTFIDTGNFRSARVAVAPDRSIWVSGSQGAGNKHQDHYGILRKYSHDGKLLGSFLDRSTFREGLAPGWPGSALFAAADRTAIMAYSGQNGIFRELIELDLEGNVLGRMRFDDGPNLLYRRLTSDYQLKIGWFMPPAQ